MYISKLELNPRRKEVLRDLADPYQMHRTLSWSVAQALTQGKERLLWRLEPLRRDAPPIVIVQTLSLPNWDALLTRNPAYARIFPPKPFDPFLTPGDTLVFRLRANAAVKRAGKRYALKSREEKLDWLGRHLEAGGCSVLASDILEDTFIHASRGDDALSVQATLFQGRLRVQDPAKARAMVEKGIGPAKALGLGLLSLCRR